MSAGRLALIDVDGTLTPVRSIWQHLLEQSGAWSGAGEANLAQYVAGEISYEQFCQLDALLFRGQRYEDLVAIAAAVPLVPGAAELVAGLQRSGFHVALVSTGLRVLTTPLAERLGADSSIANDLETAAGVCTGRAVVEIDEADKGIHARRLIDDHGGAFTVAIGDGTGDVPMFREADLAIAVGAASSTVAAAAHHHHRDPVLTDLLALIETAADDRVTA